MLCSLETAKKDIVKMGQKAKKRPLKADALDIGIRLEKKRKAKGYSQDRLADAIKVTKSTISGYETGLYTPSLGALVAICKELETTADYLIRGIESPTPMESLTKMIVSQEILQTKEKEYGDDEIWIVSPDLSTDVEGGDPRSESVMEVVRGNLKANKTPYLYIVPNTEIIRDRIDYLEATFIGYEKYLQLVIVPNDLGSFLFNEHICVFNPRWRRGKAPVVYYELPLAERGWWIEVVGNRAERLRGWLKELITKHPLNYPDSWHPI